MAKKLMILLALFWFVASPAWAADWVCYEGYQIEQPAPLFAADEFSEEGAATSSSMIYYDIMPMADYQEFEDGMPSATYMDWAAGFLNKVHFDENYVFARTGQYQYIMAIGDFGSSFSGSARVHILELARSGIDYSYSMIEDDFFSLSVGSSLVYPSIDGYPSLPGYDRTADILFVSSIVIMALLGLWIARLVFSPLLGWR